MLAEHVELPVELPNLTGLQIEDHDVSSELKVEETMSSIITNDSETATSEPTNGVLSPSELLKSTTPSGKPFRSRHGPEADPKTTPPFVFGQRLLSAEDDVFDYNAWDHVETDDVYKEYMREQIEKQKEKPVSEFDRSKLLAQQQHL